ncbi:zinc-ribbon domain-containing protein [Caballeronia sp.]|uniref:zinc-ribbon domain-containing protein n=1 Tax=Caballeronia sp. TaxID=1931223 RepID=UPI003C5A13B8
MAYRKTIEDMRALAARKKGQCLSLEYRGMEAKLLWRCDSGHEWQAIPEQIQQGSWCPQCAILKMRDTLERMREIAQERGGRCVSTEYINTNTALLWECANGHQWKAQPASIKRPRASWCPVCAKDSSRKHTLAWAHGLAEKHGGKCLSKQYKGTTVPLEWCCDKGHKWTTTAGAIDAGKWCRQCYNDSRRFSLADAQALAEKHKGHCVSKRYTDAKTTLLWKCEKGHRWRARLTTIYRSWCPTCAFDRKRLGVEKMHEIAAAHGGVCLSQEYTNGHALLQWRCQKGHVWLARPDKIMSGHWCRTCAIDRTRLGIETMRQTAAMRGGKCLSDTYVNLLTPLQWQCIEGHTWTGKPDSIRRGHWCPVCRHKEVAENAKIRRTRKKTRFRVPILI